MWTEWLNGTGFVGVDGYVALLGLAGCIYSLTSYEVSTTCCLVKDDFKFGVRETHLLLLLQAGSHMAEETLNANITVPRAMIASTAVSAVTGFWILIALLFYTTQPTSTSSLSDSSSDNSLTGFASYGTVEDIWVHKRGNGLDATGNY